MGFEKIVEDIKSLKIQSAENVAKYSILALKDYASKIDFLTKTHFLDELEKAKKILFKSRPTEPCMRNAINFVLFELEKSSLNMLKLDFNQRINFALDHFSTSLKLISEIGARRITNNSKIFTHCHSNTVMGILKEAKKHKKFEVLNTETRPRFQGRTTALELSKAGIPVTHYIDSAARLAIKKADMMLIGCDAINSEGKCYNKIGSEMFAEIANKFDVPVYIATDSWKFDSKSIFGFNEEIESRSRDEVWPEAPKKIKIVNLAFEKIDPESISGILSELGIFRPSSMLEIMKHKYPFMFI